MGVPSLVCGFAFSSLRPLRCDSSCYVVGSCAVVTITTLLVLARQHHVHVNEDSRERWRLGSRDGFIMVRTGVLIPAGPQEPR